MFVGIAKDPDRNCIVVTDYSPDIYCVGYCDINGEYVAKENKYISSAQEHRCIFDKDTPYVNLMTTLICGAIGEGASRAMEELGIKVYGNVSGTIEEAIEAYKNNKLVYGGYKKLPARQNLLEYWLVFRGNNKKMSAAYPRGMELYGSSLTDKDKAWIADEFCKNPGRRQFLPYMASVLNYKFDLKRAIKYMNSFLKVWFTYKTERNLDTLRYQRQALIYIKVLAENIKPEDKLVFLGETLIVAAKNRLILIAEYLMDNKADISYVNNKGLSVEKYETSMNDITMASYLSYYRTNGVKKGSGEEYFKVAKRFEGKSHPNDDIVRYYMPKLADDDGLVFGKVALTVCKDVLKDYDKSSILKKTAKAEALDSFIEEYNWDDGLEVPYFIAVHPNCGMETKKKIFDLAEGCMFGTKDFENSDDIQWKTLLTELHKMIEGSENR